MKGNVLFGVLCVLVAVATACSNGKGKAQSQTSELILTYIENQAESYPTVQGTYKFTELVRERTGGRIKIQANAEVVLGNEKTAIEQLQFSGVDFARVSLSPLAEFVPKPNVLQIPYLYTRKEHIWRVLEGPISDDFMNSFDGSNLVALSWYDIGAGGFYDTSRLIEALEDMRGLNIRTQESGLMMDIIETLGVAPIPTAFGDMYSRLQIGRIDGAEDNWPSYEFTKHYEVARYFTLDEYARMPELQLVT